MSQPTLQREGDARLTGASSKGGKRVELPLIRGKHWKNQKFGLRTLSVKGSGVVFTHGEGISTPHIHHKGRQSLIKCAISWLRFVFIFPFFMFFYLLCFLCFLLFVFFILLWSTRVFPFILHIPQLRWENQTYLVLSELNVG